MWAALGGNSLVAGIVAAQRKGLPGFHSGGSSPRHFFGFSATMLFVAFVLPDFLRADFFLAPCPCGG